jgi:site-specific recombinase XerD
MLIPSMTNLDRFFYWLAEVKRSAPNTIKNYRFHLRALAERGGDILSTIKTYPQFEALNLDVKQSRGWSDRATYKSAVIAKTYFDWAFREGLIQFNPLALGHSFKKTDVYRIEFFDWKSIEFQKLLKSPRNTVRTMAILHVLRSSGIRAGELCNLRQNDQIGRVLKVDGKTGKRDAIIDEEALKWLTVYREGLKLHYSGDWLFTDEKMLGRLSEHALWRHISNIGARLGIVAYPHKFRHSLAGAYISAGGDIGGAAALLGHKSTNMTMRYFHANSQQKTALYDKFLQKG